MPIDVMYANIITLRPYLEKIKGCRQPDIFHIRPLARIISGSECVCNVDARISLRVSPSCSHACGFSTQQL